MSLPPYNHTRNPALEKEDEYKEYPAPSVPLITHSGVIEKRKTTDRSLIRSGRPHAEVEFQYLPVISSSGSAIVSQKRNISKMKKIRKTASNQEKKNNNCCSKVHDNEIKIDKLANNDEELNNKISSKSENSKEMEKQIDSESICSHTSKHSKRSVRKNREPSTKSNVSNDSVCSRRSAKSAVTVSSGTSTIKNVINDKEGNRRPFSTTEFRRIANGLDEEDLFPHRRR